MAGWRGEQRIKGVRNFYFESRASEWLEIIRSMQVASDLITIYHMDWEM